MAQAISRLLLTAEGQFDPLLVRVRFVADRMALDRFFFEYCVPLLISFHGCSILIFICILLLPEGQTREA